jgi:PPM family protein phosphatase
VHIVGRTHPGRVRRRNEDHVAVDAALGAAVLADGMGGLRDGHIASREAVTAALEYLRTCVGERDAGSDTPGHAPDMAAAALLAANQRVREAAGSEGAAMGTTGVAMLLLADGSCGIAHVGDSRAYHLGADGLTAVTRDHSLVRELMDRGLLDADSARHSTQRNVVTRAIGLGSELQVDRTAVSVASDDILVLCSDGLWDMLDDAQIEALLSRCGAGLDGLSACADALIDAANRAGGTDNIAVVLARRP